MQHFDTTILRLAYIFFGAADVYILFASFLQVVIPDEYASTILFLARDSMLSALYAIARPSVCPSVRPSVRHTGGSVENG